MTRSCDAEIQDDRSEALPERRGNARRRHVNGQRRVRAGSEQARRQEFSLGAGHRESSTPRPAAPRERLVGLTVLVVDDDEASLDYFATALRIAGAVVATASSAAAAVRLVQLRPPDVILSDIAMPGYDGYWLLREIREHPDAHVRGVPVVATTAYGHEHSRETTLRAGFADHLPKPVEPDLLYATLARAAGRSA